MRSLKRDAASSSWTLYTVALFADSSAAEVTRINSPRAVKIKVVYDGDLPDKVPEWAAELMPALPAEDEARLRWAYRHLTSGDVIVVCFSPGEGTTLSINQPQVLADEGDGLLQAFLDLFVGDDPVSDNLKEKLR